MKENINYTDLATELFARFYLLTKNDDTRPMVLSHFLYLIQLRGYFENNKIMNLVKENEIDLISIPIYFDLLIIHIEEYLNEVELQPDRNSYLLGDSLVIHTIFNRILIPLQDQNLGFIQEKMLFENKNEYPEACNKILCKYLK